MWLLLALWVFEYQTCGQKHRKQTYPNLTSLIRLMNASFFSFAFLLKFSPFNPSLRKFSRSKQQTHQVKTCTQAKLITLHWLWCFILAAKWPRTDGDHLTLQNKTTQNNTGHTFAALMWTAHCLIFNRSETTAALWRHVTGLKLSNSLSLHFLF